MYAAPPPRDLCLQRDSTGSFRGMSLRGLNRSVVVHWFPCPSVQRPCICCAIAKETNLKPKNEDPLPDVCLQTRMQRRRNRFGHNAQRAVVSAYGEMKRLSS